MVAKSWLLVSKGCHLPPHCYWPDIHLDFLSLHWVVSPSIHTFPPWLHHRKEAALSSHTKMDDDVLDSWEDAIDTGVGLVYFASKLSDISMSNYIKSAILLQIPL